jgi:hypothetical protein
VATTKPAAVFLWPRRRQKSITPPPPIASALSAIERERQRLDPDGPRVKPTMPVLGFLDCEDEDGADADAGRRA